LHQNLLKKVMKALIIIDAQNEFSQQGKRPVPGHAAIIEVIKNRADEFRASGLPIAWVRHFNKPTESPAFVPGTWGAEFVGGLGPKEGSKLETEFQKNVYGAFTGSQIGAWLKALSVGEVLIVGFYTHGCVSTTAREAIMPTLPYFLTPRAPAHAIWSTNCSEPCLPMRCEEVHCYNWSIWAR
jgi:nicotinamidase-related amidase